MTIDKKTLIAMPAMSMMHTASAECFVNMRKGNGVSFGITQNSLVYDARNDFAWNAINQGFERVLWIDSDMTYERYILERLYADMDDGDKQYVSALAFTRKLPTAPVVYSDLTYDAVNYKAHAEPYYDYPIDSIFPIAASGFGAVMTSVNLLKQVWDKYGPPFEPLPHMGEDISFCWRVKQLGVPMWCDSRVKVGHIGQVEFNEATYLNQQKQLATTPEENQSVT